MLKNQIRTQIILQRRMYIQTLKDNERASLEAQLMQIALPHLAKAQTIAAYHPFPSEISPQPLLNALGEKQTILFPWFADRTSPMIFRQAPASEPGPWGTNQPSAQSPALAPDIVLVPLVAVDMHGTRIGMGKGHYDRALAGIRGKNPAVRAIGLAWDMQVVDTIIPADSWDQRLNAIATPNRWIEC